MAWVATNANGLEFLFIEKPYRSGYGTQRIEVLYECYDKIEWLDFDELK